MREKIEIRKGYRHEEGLRGSFNKLAQETFGLDFEDWYRNGYWTEKYNPYSVIIDEQVVANVSVNQMEFALYQEGRRYIQLGTVMTHKDYRKQGLIAMLMQEIEKDYQGLVDGYYLFANDSVTEFYPRFGYKKGIEYQYTKRRKPKSHTEKQPSIMRAKQISMNQKENWTLLEQAIETATTNALFDMKNNTGLVMFYLTQFMQENVYFVEEEQAIVVAEREGEKLSLHAIYSKQVVDMETIIDAFGEEIEEVILHFTPLSVEGYEVEQRNEEGSTLFLKGNVLELFAENQFMFPTISHA